MAKTPERLDPRVEPSRDHVLGPTDAEITLVEYGSYVCSYCHAAHEVIRHLRDEFGDRIRYAFRHLPLADRHEARRERRLRELGPVDRPPAPRHDRARAGAEQLGRGPRWCCRSSTG